MKHNFLKIPTLLILIFIIAACSPEDDQIEQNAIEPKAIATNSAVEIVAEDNQATVEPDLYRSEAGNYSVLFPANTKVNEITETMVLENGKLELTSATFTDQQSGIEYVTMYGVMPGMLISPESKPLPATFKSMGQTMVQSFPELVKHSTGKTKWIDYNGYPGQEISYENVDMGAIDAGSLTTRVHLIHNHIYMLLAHYPATSEAKSNAVAFLDSFSILEPPTKVILSEWETFFSPDGDFAVSLPTQPGNASSGDDKAYSVLDDVATINITSRPLSNRWTPMTDELFDEFITGRINNLKTQSGIELISDSEFNVGSYFGFRFTLKQSLATQDNIEEGIILVAGSRIYSVSISTPEGQFDQERAEALFDSFEFLEVVEALPDSESAWITFKSQSGRFTVLMPQEPQENVLTDETEWGSINMHSYMASGESGEFYSASFYKMPELPEGTPFDIEGALEGGMNGTIQNVSGELLRFESIEFEGSPGRYFIATIPKSIIASGGTLYSQLFIIDDFVYQLTSVMPGLELDEEKFAPFFNSFQTFEPKSETSSLGFQWDIYTSDNREFQIELPDRYPTETVETDQLPVGVEKQTLILAPNGETINYGIILNDYPAGYFDSGLVTHETAIQVLKFYMQIGFQGDLVSEKRIQVGESEGLELTFNVISQTDFQDAQLIARIFVQNERSYIPMILGERSSFNQEDTDRFFSSFMFLSEGE